MPQVVEGPPDEAWDVVLNHQGWSGLQLMQQHDFELFEQLPPGVRFAMQEAVFVWETKSLHRQVMPALASGIPEFEVVAIVAEAIRKQDLEDVRQEAAVYRWRYGEPYPHLAAHATFVRYDEASRHGRAPPIAGPSSVSSKPTVYRVRSLAAQRPTPPEVRPAKSDGPKKRRSVDSAAVPKVPRKSRKRRE